MSAFKIFPGVLIAMIFQGPLAYPQESDNYMFVFVRINNSGNSFTEEEIQVMENEHLRHISRMSENGDLANAGPLEGGGEILILNTATVDEANELLKNDPVIKNNIYSVEVFSFKLEYGKVCEPVIPYEMKTYTLVRYRPTNQIASYKANMDYRMQSGHKTHIDKLIKSGNVLIVGNFPGNDGGIIIYKKDMLNKLVETDPSIENGYMNIQTKTVWLNKGSFCNR